MGGPCSGGRCSGSVRCARHAALYSRWIMEKQGWVCIAEYGDTTKPATPEFLDMVKAVNEAGTDMQHWTCGWDDERGRPLYGIWAPRVAAAILGVVMGKDHGVQFARMSVAQLKNALVAATIDQDFVQAVDAAYRLGGRSAARDVVLEHVPKLADYGNVQRRRR